MARFLGLVLLFAAAALASEEDLNWSEPNTAQWAIAREHSFVSDIADKAAAKVDAAAEQATQRGKAAAEAQVEAWLKPIREAAAAKGLDLDQTGCVQSVLLNPFEPVFESVRSAVPLCVVAGRASWDDKVKGFRKEADKQLELLVKVQKQIKTCAALPNQLLQELCRHTKVSGTVIDSQAARADKAAAPWWDFRQQVDANVLAVSEACVAGAAERASFQASMATRDTLECVEQAAAKQNP